MSVHEFSAMRASMVSNQLRTNAVTNLSVIRAMETVEREDFVPADRQALAYVDVSVPLTVARSLNAPLTTARLLCESDPKPGDKILLIGAATGYAIALLVNMGVAVVAVEDDVVLEAALRQNFSGQAHVAIISSPLSEGHSAGAPYDAIIIDGAVEQVPQTLWDQLNEGGLIVAGLVDRGVTRLASGRKFAGSGVMKPFMDLNAAVLPGFAAAAGFRF